MCASQREACHSVVLKLRGSLLGSMALPAVSTEPGLVYVVFLMTVDTSLFADLVHIVDVARAASNRLVLALEGERRVIEIVDPGRVEWNQGRVALGTIVSELTLVIVLVAVTARSFARSIDLVLVAPDAVILGLEFAVSAQ